MSDHTGTRPASARPCPPMLSSTRFAAGGSAGSAAFLRSPTNVCGSSASNLSSASLSSSPESVASLSSGASSTSRGTRKPRRLCTKCGAKSHPVVAHEPYDPYRHPRSLHVIKVGDADGFIWNEGDIMANSGRYSSEAELRAAQLEYLAKVEARVHLLDSDA